MTLHATVPAELRFTGLWHIRRDIFDFDSQWSGRFTGQGIFQPTETNRRAYAEEGSLQFAGLHSVKATRRYGYDIVSKSRVEVRFEDGRFFHHFDPAGQEAWAEHLCDADLYEVRYLFDAEDHWRAEWRVEGPRKNYRMVTRYDRDPARLQRPLRS